MGAIHPCPLSLRARELSTFHRVGAVDDHRLTTVVPIEPGEHPPAHWLSPVRQAEQGGARRFKQGDLIRDVHHVHAVDI